MALDLASLKILVVEDHRAQAAALQAMRQAFGITHVDIANDADMAARLLGGTSYDLMLCDYNLGTGNGLSLVKTLRADHLSGRHAMPIIMLTGDARPDRNILARDAGVNDFLSKPAHPQVLLRMIRTMLEPAP